MISNHKFDVYTSNIPRIYVPVLLVILSFLTFMAVLSVCVLEVPREVEHLKDFKAWGSVVTLSRSPLQAFEGPSKSWLPVSHRRFLELERQNEEKIFK